MTNVYVVGSINQDVVARAERHPRPGETVMGTGLERHPGGKGANQAIAAARAGASTFMIGRTGDDAPGAELRAYLRAAGVDISLVTTDRDAPTGTAFVTVAGGENTIVVVSGANARLAPGASAGVTLAVGDIVVAQFETPLAAIIDVFSTAKAAGARTMLNAAPAADVPAELFAITDILVVNAHEFETIFGDTVAALRQTQRLPRFVVERFAGTLVLTLGADGALVFSPGEAPVHEAGLPVAVVDSTGAGDCVVGYVAAALTAGRTVSEAARLANRAAAISVTRRGAASSIPTRAEVDSAGGQHRLS